MTNLEYGLKNGLMEWKVNELMGYVNITIHDVYPNSNDDLYRLLEFLVSKFEEKKEETEEKDEL